jgi:hypothetical protein
MADHIEDRTFTGTPDEWWEQAEPVTEAEAAEREYGSWYIVAEMRGGTATDTYRISRTTKGSNEQRKNALRLAIARGDVRAEDTSKRVRALIRVHVEPPAWLESDLVMADREPGSSKRTPYRRNTSGRWTQVFGGKTLSEQSMQELNPAPASITEG